MLELEGTWEEIVARVPELAGRRVRVTVLTEEVIAPTNGSKPTDEHLAAWQKAIAEMDAEWEKLSPAERFAIAMLKAEELEATMDYSLPDDSVALIREAREGAMYGYEPGH